jgi:hypothetical protein
VFSSMEAHNGGVKDNILLLCRICSKGLTGTKAWKFSNTEATSAHCASDGNIEVHSQ